MKKTISGTTTQFLYDGLNPVQELNSGNVATANLLTGLNIDEFFSRTDSSGARSFLTDMLGSTLALTDSSGTIQTQYTFEPFGNVTVSGAASGNSYQFTGRENDGSGLYYYRARYYSPTYQRFIAQDPIDFRGGPNLYAYALNEPVDHRDPFGLWVVGIGGQGSGGLVGGGGSYAREIVIDGEGNVGVATTTCAGGATSVATAGGALEVSINPSAQSIYDLGGPSLDVGTVGPLPIPGLGASVNFGNNTCGKPTRTYNGYLGGAASWPPDLNFSLSGEGCHTTVTPIQWSITGPTGGDVPSIY